jgi:hypothetical protein
MGGTLSTNITQSQGYRAKTKRWRNTIAVNSKFNKEGDTERTKALMERNGFFKGK